MKYTNDNVLQKVRGVYIHTLLLFKFYSKVANLYQTAFVQVAHGTLKYLFAHLKASLDVFGIALVAKVAGATIVFKILYKSF